MKDKFESFCDALERLKEALRAEPTDLNQDATIQRFEFTYELAWKVMKALLFKDGVECFSPRDCIKSAFQANYFNNEEVWISMIKDRNLTTHIYNKEQASNIYHKIKDIYSKEFDSLKKYFKGKI